MTQTKKPAEQVQGKDRAQPQKPLDGAKSWASLPGATSILSCNEKPGLPERLLSMPDLQSVQRQELAVHIGQLGGNRRLQDLLQVRDSAGKSLDQNGPIMRTPDDPPTHASTAVPGLTTEQAETAQQALATSPQTAVTTIVNALAARGQMDLSYLHNRAVMYVSDRARLPEGHFGNTTLTPGTGEPRPCRVEVGPDAMTSVSTLYSTIMHEYQHVLQMRSRRDGGEAGGEMEAYLWEVAHLQETGMWRRLQDMTQLSSALQYWWERCTADEHVRYQEKYDAARTTITTWNERRAAEQFEMQMGRAPAQRSVVQRSYEEWTREEVRAIQTQLRRLGLYRISIDGILGPMTEIGLTESFGGQTWRTLDPDTALTRLQAAQPTAGGRSGEHMLRYGEMFQDGILDMSLGIGFDEGGAHETTITRFQQVLQRYHFSEDRAGAVELFRQAGRAMGPSAFGQFFVRRNALTYRPPAGEERQIHAVVRLVYSQTGGEGGEASRAFEEGMVSSDVAYYSGHGRYGSGPDFDRNMSFELLDEEGNVTEEISDYDVLEQRMRNEGRRSGRGAWQQFRWRERNNRLNVIGANMGNIYLNPANLHHGEFGSNLMYWNLNRVRGGAPLATGEAGQLAAMASEQQERRYRLLVFDGCRTRDYERSLRRTPGFGARQADIFATRRTVSWGDETATLAAFLDSTLNQMSAEAIVRDMDAQQRPERRGGRRGGAFSGFGLEENPVVR